MSEFILFLQLVITSSIYQEQRNESKKVNLSVTDCFEQMTHAPFRCYTAGSVCPRDTHVSPTPEAAVVGASPVKFSLLVEVLVLSFLSNALLQWLYMSLSLCLLVTTRGLYLHDRQKCAAEVAG